MPSSGKPEFVHRIVPTWENAKAVQALTLQDVKAGGFPNPEQIANPANVRKVTDQLSKLVDYPERYSGYMLDGKLVAYLKQNEWLIGDELPFVGAAQKAALKAKYAFTKNASTGEWYIPGLVASDQLSPAQREDVLVDLLERALLDPETGEPRVVNIVVHDHDPLLRIIPRYGFVQVGKRGDAAGAEGLKQPRFQRKVSR